MTAGILANPAVAYSQIHFNLVRHWFLKDPQRH
jgi:hypothetical protein